MKTRLSLPLAIPFALLMLTGLLGCVAFAQEVVAPVIPPDAVASFLGGLVTKYPWIATVLAVIGACRVLIKPLFTFLHSVVHVTPSAKDDELLAKIEGHKIFGWVVWALDYLFSIKLVHPGTESQK